MLAPLILSAVNTLVSIALFTALFAAIYKVLPDTPIAWRDVRTGAFLTALRQEPDWLVSGNDSDQFGQRRGRRPDCDPALELLGANISVRIRDDESHL